MSFRTDRRRRMLSEEPSSDATGGAEESVHDATPPTGKRETYIAAALRDEAVRLIDFLPIGYLTISGLALTGMILVGALAAAHAWLPAIADWGGELTAEAFDLGRRGGLATWFGSTMWSLTAFWCLVVFSLRRHRLDDIRGRYRVWLPAAAAALALSLDTVVDCRRVGIALVAPLANWLGATPSLIWGVTVATILSVLIIRLGFELREAKAALGALVVGVCLLAAATLAPTWWSDALDPQRLGLLAGAGLMGQLLVFLAIGLYGRHVLLDASGLLKPRSAKPKRARKAKASPITTLAEPSPESVAPVQHKKPIPHGQSTRIDAAESPSPHYAERNTDFAVKSTAPVHRSYDLDDDDDSSDAYSGLSRAERKKLRRQQRKAERDQ